MHANVGTEWLVDAYGCRAEDLRSPEQLGAVFERLTVELELRAVRPAVWHRFPGAGGVTGVLLLTESHLTCHTYPEFGAATFNLYCCRARPAWPWAERLAEALGATRVEVRAYPRCASRTGRTTKKVFQNAPRPVPTGLAAVSHEGRGKQQPRSETPSKRRAAR